MEIVFEGLPTLGEGGLHQALEALHGAGVGSRLLEEPDAQERRADLGRGEEGPGAEAQRDVHLRPKANQHGKDAVLLGARMACDAARDFVLEHDVRVADVAPEREDPPQQRARDVVRQVARDPRALGHEARQIRGECVGFDDLHVREGPCAEVLRELRIDLHGHHPAATRGQGQGEGAGAGADLEEDVVRPGRHGAQQALDRRCAEEVLPESSAHSAEPTPPRLAIGKNEGPR